MDKQATAKVVAISREPKELAAESLRRAKQTWGATAWARLSPRERKEKVGAEFLSIICGWHNFESMSEDIKYVGGIAKQILRTLEDEGAKERHDDDTDNPAY